MFAVDGWKLPSVVPQKAERKRKEPSDVNSTTSVKKQKTIATQTKGAKEPVSKKPGKDKSKYTPYGKEKGTSGSNVIPVNKVRKPRPKSPSPEPLPNPKTTAQEQRKPGKKPLARPPRSERDKTPPKLVAAEPPPTFTGLSSKNLTPLQQKMAAKLSGARFRWINERLYTTTGSEALSLISSKPDMFGEYHAGFKSQVKDWPLNPIDIYHRRLESLLTDFRGKAGGRRVVADLGCGEAMLAHNMLLRDPHQKTIQVKSFDLLAANERIIAADIAHLPLPDDSVHVVIFCLSLMGTDFLSFIREAFRILKSNGALWISEIKSRFNDKDAKNFIEALKKIGFQLVDKDDSNKMFIQLDFVRGKERKSAAEVVEQQDTKKVGTLLKPCTYKKR